MTVFLVWLAGLLPAGFLSGYVWHDVWGDSPGPLFATLAWPVGLPVLLGMQCRRFAIRREKRRERLEAERQRLLSEPLP